VLTHLLRTGEERLGSLRGRLLAAFDPEQHLENELRARLERLVERGEMAAEDAGRVLEQLLRRDTPPQEKAPLAAETMADLHGRLAALEKELAGLRGADQAS
jgi:hypothetical protein